MRQIKFWNLGIFAKIFVHLCFIRSGLTCFKPVYNFVVVIIDVVNKSVGKNGKFVLQLAWRPRGGVGI